MKPSSVAYAAPDFQVSQKARFGALAWNKSGDRVELLPDKAKTSDCSERGPHYSEYATVLAVTYHEVGHVLAHYFSGDRINFFHVPVSQEAIQRLIKNNMGSAQIFTSPGEGSGLNKSLSRILCFIAGHEAQKQYFPVNLQYVPQKFHNELALIQEAGLETDFENVFNELNKVCSPSFEEVSPQLIQKLLNDYNKQQPLLRKQTDQTAVLKEKNAAWFSLPIVKVAKKRAKEIFGKLISQEILDRIVFKVINDYHGHVKGKDVPKLIKGSIQEAGGDIDAIQKAFNAPWPKL